MLVWYISFAVKVIAMTLQCYLKYAVLAQDADRKVWTVQLTGHELIYKRAQAILRISYDPSTYRSSHAIWQNTLLRYQIADIFGSQDLQWRHQYDLGIMEFEVGKDFCSVYKPKHMYQIEEH